MASLHMCSWWLPRVICFHEGHENEKSAVIDLNLTLAADHSGEEELILGSIAMDQMLHSVQARELLSPGYCQYTEGTGPSLVG